MTSPLRGRTVVVLRPRVRGQGLADRLVALGADVVVAPAIEIRPGDVARLRGAVDELAGGSYVAIAFTSPNGVAALADAMTAPAAGPLGGVVVAAVGRGTAAAVEAAFGVTPDICPVTSTAEALGEAFRPGVGKVLLPRGDLATDVLPAVLRAKGYETVEVVAYVTASAAALPEEALRALRDDQRALVAVTSASTARNFAALAGVTAAAPSVVSIGPVTSAACREVGLRVVDEADPHDVDGLVAALERAARHQT